MSSQSPCPELAMPLGNVETDRLVLRRFEDGDADLLAPIFAKQEFWHFPYGRGFTHQETQRFVETQMAEWDRFGLGCWVAISKADERPVGYLGISVPHFLPEILPAVEVGWRLDPDAWGHGFATEGAQAALNEGFGRLGLSEIWSAPQSENLPSIRVCERLGMPFDRVVTGQGNAMRGPVQVSLCRITREQWLNPVPPAA